MHVASVDKLTPTSSGWPLQIHGKNFLNVTFVIPKEKESQDFYSSLTRLSQPGPHLSDTYLLSSCIFNIDSHGLHVASSFPSEQDSTELC